MFYVIFLDTLFKLNSRQGGRSHILKWNLFLEGTAASLKKRGFLSLWGGSQSQHSYHSGSLNNLLD